MGNETMNRNAVSGAKTVNQTSRIGNHRLDVEVFE
jgi:hypothetical protein